MGAIGLKSCRMSFASSFRSLAKLPMNTILSMLMDPLKGMFKFSKIFDQFNLTNFCKFFRWRSNVASHPKTPTARPRSLECWITASTLSRWIPAPLLRVTSAQSSTTGRYASTIICQKLFWEPYGPCYVQVEKQLPFGQRPSESGMQGAKRSDTEGLRS